MSRIQNDAVLTQEDMWRHEEWTSIALGARDSVQEELLDANVKCLLGLGIVPIILGIVTGIWPMALAGLGPWLLAWLDIGERRRGRKH